MPTSGWLTATAVLTAVAFLLLLLAANFWRQASLYAASTPLLLLTIYLIRIAIRRRAARGDWDTEVARLGFENFIPKRSAIDAWAQSHPILAKQDHGGIEKVALGRIHGDQVVLIQVAFPLLPAELNIVLAPFLWALCLLAATTGDPGGLVSVPTGYTTVLLLRRQNVHCGDERLGEWTLSFAEKSTAVFVERRGIEPNNLEAFLEAALSVCEQEAAARVAQA